MDWICLCNTSSDAQSDWDLGNLEAVITLDSIPEQFLQWGIAHYPAENLLLLLGNTNTMKGSTWFARTFR